MIRTRFRDRHLVLCTIAVVGTAIVGVSVLAQGRRPAIQPSDDSGRRIALVIGNNNYVNAPLRNAVADATAIGRILEADLGFRVVRSFNEPLEAVEQTLDGFIATVMPGDVALVYYSGHGVEIRGENYLLPVDFRAEQEAQVKRRAVAIAEVEERLAERGARVRLMILDACRDNPFRAIRSGSGGFAAMQAQGALIAFATAPGQTASDNPSGANGLFTQELLKWLPAPGVSVSELFRRVRQGVNLASSGRQFPWVADGLIGDLILKRASAVAPSPAPAAAPAPVNTEVVFWESIRNSSDPADFEAYLARYPKGDFAGLAATRRDRLRAPASEANPALSPSPAPTPTLRISGSPVVGPSTPPASSIGVAPPTMFSTRGSLTAPVNDLSNPYVADMNWGQLPSGRSWGATSAVDIDRDGRSVWVAIRCDANSCWDSARGQMSPVDPIVKFDSKGRFVTSFGRGLMVMPHGMHVDGDGNVWVTDGQDNLPRRTPGSTQLSAAPDRVIGHQVFKFSPQGRLLMILGTPGGNAPGQPSAPDSFYQPNDVITLTNGDIIVAEGHGPATARLIRFDRTGRFISEFGRRGAGASGEFDAPHALALDASGRLFVADRGNNRIQVLDSQSLQTLQTWYQFSRLSDVFIDRAGTLYGADSESGSVNLAHGGWARGIRIGAAMTGNVEHLIPEPTGPGGKGTLGAEGVAVDSAGVIYAAEVASRRVVRYIRKGR